MIPSVFLQPMHRVAGHLLLMEAALLVLWAPVLGLLTASRVMRRGVVLVNAWQLSRALAIRISLVSLASIAVVLAMRTTMSVSVLGVSHLMLWTAAFTFAMVGAACLPLCREPLDGAACAVAISCIGALMLFAAGPILDSVPAWLVNAALTINPVAATAAAADIDLWRTDLLYRLSPIAHRDIASPALSTTFATYGLAAGSLLFLTARVVASRMSVVSSERISS